MLETLRTAVEVLPQLVSELQSGQSGRTDVTQLAARAHALASGREVPAGPPAVPATAPAAAPSVAAPLADSATVVLRGGLPAEALPAGAAPEAPAAAARSEPQAADAAPVSYTHLDVYKRQVLHRALFECRTARRGGAGLVSSQRAATGR